MPGAVCWPQNRKFTLSRLSTFVRSGHTRQESIGVTPEPLKAGIGLLVAGSPSVERYLPTAAPFLSLHQAYSRPSLSTSIRSHPILDSNLLDSVFGPPDHQRRRDWSPFSACPALALCPFTSKMQRINSTAYQETAAAGMQMEDHWINPELSSQPHALDMHVGAADVR